jgi:hypothetical protein
MSSAAGLRSEVLVVVPGRSRSAVSDDDLGGEATKDVLELSEYAEGLGPEMSKMGHPNSTMHFSANSLHRPT